MIALAEICRDVIEEASRQHGDLAIELNDWDEAFGDWDREQVARIVRLLLSNAVAHGGAEEPLLISVIDGGENALLAIACRGPAVDAQGLQVVKEIVYACRGWIELTGANDDTVFHVSLPKFAS